MDNATQINITGGVKIGMFRASWPFATLAVDPGRLEIKASILGNFVFLPGEIVSIQRASGISFLGNSIQINHTVKEYSSTIFFQCNENPDELINRIYQIFVGGNQRLISDEEVAALAVSRSAGVFPLKKGAVVAVIVIWNAFIFYDLRHLFIGSDQFMIPGAGMKLAVTFMFVLCLSLLVVKPVQVLMLKEGKSIGGFSVFLCFLAGICLFMLIGMLAISA